MDIQLEIRDLTVAIDEVEILHGINLTVPKGEVHAIMGPNGSGKSTLSQAIFGHPKYAITGGSINFKGQDIVALAPDKRANLGLFLAFQSPNAVPGVKISTFLKQAVNARRRATDPDAKVLKIREYRELLEGTMDTLHMKREFADRYLNDGFSGGEKKKSEILQMAVLNPDIAVVDEIDSGLDVDALRVVAAGINTLREQNQMGVLIITHYPRILKYIEPDAVHIMMDGNIVNSGDKSLAHKIEEQGYDWLRA
ncbi:MAG: Fe-S cluster assembly ATPase SufC [Candidatus Kerfeldbacteria bacterium CG15_BIG_FIL_POST_REV_8_21_14_020_45_12]|uniref:Fe-S cluster assembly ATPase SufC n=1 Tax=Candidatus Kerfeldbacteria bacterium CG15_BIG_FIL_POST_REV_8_21_14_020_45_12 TaxID=2014247 RepID=A0A2M7H3X6_9BACT|nr:MAG: Fe-S cluster assembly ATPase SufC [Candidatus Kerfeldbacteria bacterium CG15_BIG_FIL_POST_REV_8_21_14_020_45_12]PJA92760.1 MAG: Fe-S cluster assembly ATPase SufC [Candidatus Kerfeldbacteria bacterium CG_4_9_14_3_um_filter_45_8]